MSKKLPYEYHRDQKQAAEKEYEDLYMDMHDKGQWKDLIKYYGNVDGRDYGYQHIADTIGPEKMKLINMRFQELPGYEEFNKKSSSTSSDSSDLMDAYLKR